MFCRHILEGISRIQEDFKSVFKKIAREHISDIHCKSREGI